VEVGLAADRQDALLFGQHLMLGSSLCLVSTITMRKSENCLRVSGDFRGKRLWARDDHTAAAHIYIFNRFHIVRSLAFNDVLVEA